MASYSLYKDAPLNTSTPSIRLLERLDSGTGTSRYALHVFQLAKCPKYVALSYEWGPTEPSRPVRINDHKINLGMNLCGFLAQADKAVFREESAPAVVNVNFFWIDAVCINQDDLFERMNQVKLMRDIYEQVS